MRKQSDFGIKIAKTRGACVIARFWLIRRQAAMEMGLEELYKKDCWIGLVQWIWAKLPVYLYIISISRCSLERELDSYTVRIISKARQSTDYKYVSRVIGEGGRSITFTTNTISAHRHPLFQGFLSGKRRAAQIASCDLGSTSLFVLSCITRTEALLMASNAFYHRWFRLAPMFLSHACLAVLRLDL